MFGKLLFFFVFPKLGISYKAKKWQGYPCRLFFLCTIFWPKPTSTTSPQRLHLISSTVLPGGISSMSRMCRPHFGFGHLILPTDNRLPALIWNKGTKHEVFLLGSLLSFVLYWFSSCFSEMCSYCLIFETKCILLHIITGFGLTLQSFELESLPLFDNTNAINISNLCRI